MRQLLDLGRLRCADNVLNNTRDLLVRRWRVLLCCLYLGHIKRVYE